MAIIDKPTDYFRIKLYTGNNNPQNIAWDETDTNMKPDMLWIKSYAGATVFEHVLGDVVRGGGKYLVPNSTAAEVSNSNVINTFNTNGFSVGGATQVSEASRSYVAWGWKASNTTATNTAGSINSTVSVNAAAGFSVVGYIGNGSSGATVGHGLGVAPEIVLIKTYSGADAWTMLNVYSSGGLNTYLALNSSSGAVSDPMFDNTAPSSTLFTLDSDGQVNGSGVSLVAYCFASVTSFSKFGSYTGNGNADGTFVYTGFKPAFVLTKRTDSTSDWVLLDNKRDSFNVMIKKLFASNTDAEYSGQNACDFVSNGIKFRDNATNAFATNVSGATYIYMAFAENPFVTSTDNGSIPTTAR
jgi:hypothetical protein